MTQRNLWHMWLSPLNLQPQKWIKNFPPTPQNQTTCNWYPDVHINLPHTRRTFILCLYVINTFTKFHPKIKKLPDFYMMTNPEGKKTPRTNINNCRNKCEKVKRNKPNQWRSNIFPRFFPGFEGPAKVFGKFSKQINLHSTAAGSQKGKPPRPGRKGILPCLKKLKKFNPTERVSSSIKI